MRIASVVIDLATQALDKSFAYLVPDALAADARVGCAVSVEFGPRVAVGYIVALAEVDERGLAQLGVQPDKLKALAGILSDPYFDDVSAELALWIAHEYVCPLADAVRLCTPPGGSPKVKRVEGRWQLVRAGVGPVDDRWARLVEGADASSLAASAVRQRAVLEALSAGAVRVAELAAELGSVDAQLRALERRGIVRIERRRRTRGGDASMFVDAPSPAVELTRGQQRALAAIRDARARAKPGAERVVVLDGITGSGKTEVYLRAIADVLASGSGAIVLVPEIALTPQTVGRFRARFGDDVAVLHSRLSAGERFDQWDSVRNGHAHVVVGTRSALFAPLHDVGLIVMDEEHDDSYKQDSAPRYGTRDVALKLCSLRGAVLVLGSATPDMQTLAACDGQAATSRGWQRVVLDERPNGRPLPAVELVDMAAEFSGGSRSMFSATLLAALEEQRARSEKTVLLLNKRGFASFLLCRECGYVPECPQCSVSLTYHERGSQLACHHCDHHEPVPARCPKCGSPYLRKFGAGTQRVEDELRGLLGQDVPIVRMDADSVKGAGAHGHARLLERFASSPGAVLLGTQMIAKGLDFPDVTLVGVINADTALAMPDFRAGERAYQLVEQVSGRAGRADRPGRVIVQTYQPQHPALTAAAHHDRAGFLEAELATRAELAYPPFSRLANVLVWGTHEEDVKQQAVLLALALDSVTSRDGLDWTMLGPSPCMLSKLRGQFRWHILLKAPPRSDVAAVLEPLLRSRRKPASDVCVAVDVDPVSLF